MFEVRFRPLPLWPYPVTKSRRSRHTFKANWMSTLSLLDRELRQVNGRNVVIGGGWREEDIRLDGYPRASAREPSHPGVEVSFDARIGGRSLPGPVRLVYATDVCTRWEHNVRSIALGLEALRAVDRYGITRHGEQYAGFKALPSGEDDGRVSPERGLELVRKHGSYKAALFATHPDHGGNPAEFADVTAAHEAGLV